MNLDPKLLEILRCPLGKARLELKNNSLICSKCGVIYPIRDEIPSLIIEEAELPQNVFSISDLICQKEKKIR